MGDPREPKQTALLALSILLLFAGMILLAVSVVVERSATPHHTIDRLELAIFLSRLAVAAFALGGALAAVSIIVS